MGTPSDATVALDVDAIRNALADAPVTVAVLYGSYAREEAHGHSDIDLAVQFEDGLAPDERMRARLSLIRRLSVALGTDAVDVTPLAGVSPHLERQIATDGIVVDGDPAGLSLDHGSTNATHDDRLAAFDELLAELDR
ncbi:MAG: nucleotidyltransferase family protein, partial [Halobaculum sp.]